MTQQNKLKCRGLESPATSESDPKTMLEILLALDRAVVEVSMHLYNLPPRDRFVMREQNQRLHEAVREHLPRLREPGLQSIDC